MKIPLRMKKNVIAKRKWTEISNLGTRATSKDIKSEVPGQHLFTVQEDDALVVHLNIIHNYIIQEKVSVHKSKSLR